MATLADLLKIKHLMWQTTKIDARGTLISLMGGISQIETMDQLVAKRLNVLDLQIIRELYESIRRVERADHMPEILTRQITARMETRMIHHKIQESQCGHQVLL